MCCSWMGSIVFILYLYMLLITGGQRLWYQMDATGTLFVVR